jgi:pimeloyl-ACP methyl ester carboxylesterase
MTVFCLPVVCPPGFRRSARPGLRSLLRALAVFLAVLAVPLTIPFVPALAQAPVSAHAVEADTFRADGGETVAVERGTIRVPENRRTASNDSIDLSYVRFPSTSDDPGMPIVYLAGGPGATGTGAAEGDRFGLFMALREVADVIAFNQRGTGGGGNLSRCPRGWQLPADRPASREAVVAAVREAAHACRAHWDATGTDLAAYNTRESADDLNALRRALGAERISLWGISYGTHLGLAMMKRHPESVERAILAGVEGLDHTAKLPSDQQRLLEKIDAMASADAALRAKMPSLLRTIEEVLTRLEDDPVIVPYSNPRSGKRDTVVVGRFEMQFVTASMLRGPETMRGLFQLYYDADRGDFSGVAPEVAGWPRSGGFWPMYTAMDAASGASVERRQRIAREREETLLGDTINAPYLTEMTGALGAADLGPSFRLPVQSDVPTLLISGTLDGRTPPGNARDIRDGLSNSTHLLLDGAGHSDPLFLSSPRIEAVMLAFLKGKEVEDEVVTLPLPDFQIRETSDVPLATLRRYEGTYALGEGRAVSVTAHPDGLTISFPRYAYNVFPASTTLFYEKLEPNDTISFRRGGGDDSTMKMVITIDGSESTVGSRMNNGQS